MKMWSMKVTILLLFCYACLSTGNGRVSFVSRNFNNVLHWDPVNPAFPGEKILYNVQYWSDAEKQPYQMKQECQNITALSCDLTAETPSVHDVHYRAQVYVNGSCIGRTNTFKPIADTILGPSNLSIHTTVSSLHVNVTLPLGPNGVSVADIITRSKNGPYKTVAIYTLKITHPKWAAQVNKTTTGQFVINLKNNQTEYCGYVVYQPLSEWGRPESENASFCATLPGDDDNYLIILPWLLVSAALLAAIVIVAVVCTCNYVKGGKEKSMPQQLVTTSSSAPRVLEFPDRNLIISKPEVCVQSDQTVYATIQMKQNVQSVGAGGYSPQDVLCQAWQGSTGSSVGTGAHSPAPNSKDTSVQSSEIYSVVAVHVPAEDFQQATTEDTGTSKLPLSSIGGSWDKGGMGPELTGSYPAMPSFLHTVRDANGKLSIVDLNSETKPLLSDLIDFEKEGPWLTTLQSFDSSEHSDSGCDDSTVNTPTHPYCNTHYSPSQPDFHQACQSTQSSEVIFESGYKENWMPSILLGTTSKDSCEYRRTNYPWTMTGPKEEEEGEE
ncbi:interferon lambda receptor 1 [Enoplosus armatus]|uniref:interferon lambda receptor 1 n=1 Tax=Enoplosus armatus TaxID=215367 RepID=UPI003993EAA3